MSYSSLEAGHAASAGAMLYPFRELERDIQRELEAWQHRRGGPEGEAQADPDEEITAWLRSDDSPLLLHNVEKFVLDPEAHLRELTERVEGGDRAPRRPGAGLTGAPPRTHADEVRARLQTLAELDAERVLASPRRRGTPKGETRTHYVWLVSPDLDVPNAEFKRLALEIISRHWRGAVAAGYVHRDTDNTHLHVWLSAETLSGKKIDVRRRTPSGDAVLDKYPDLDEETARAFSRHFDDPSIYENHVVKKIEWVHWRERFETALGRGEVPPLMPYRARHEFDWLGERRAIANRERGMGDSVIGEKGKAAPVPRAKSLAGAIELWGKVIHLEARVSYRRELIATLDAWRGTGDATDDEVRRHFESRLEVAEREHMRHKEAFEKTLANRERAGYPKLRHPLHNSKQVAEMEQIARLTRDPELLRHVRAYTVPGRPDDAEGRAREIATLWRDYVEARLEAHERAETLARAVGLSGGAGERGPAGVAPGEGGERLDRDRVIVGGWLGGGWTPGRMRSSLACLGSEGVRAHGRRYVQAVEYLTATGEALAECRAVVLPRTVRPLLDESDLARIDRLVRGESARVGAGERALLADLASLARAGGVADPGAARRLLEATLDADLPRSGGMDRVRAPLNERVVFRPHDDLWAGRLAADLTLKEAEALALAAGGAIRSRFDAAREEAGVLRQLLALSREVRAAAGVTPAAPAAVFDAAQERTLDSNRRVVGEALRSRGAGWAEWQAEGVGEFRHALPERERERAGRLVEEARARLEEEWRAAALRRLEPQLAAAAERYLLAVYDEEGLEGMRLPLRRRGHVAALAEQFSRLARDSEVDPERLGAAALEARAERAVSETVERIGRDERDERELGRLEARMILARAEQFASAARRARFDAHSLFHDWSYKTGDGLREWGSTSLCEYLIARAEPARDGQRDPAARMVALDAGARVARRVGQIRAELAQDEAACASVAEAATAAYHMRAEGLTGLLVPRRLPAFEPGELGRLEEAAFAARRPELIALVARCEEQEFGPEYAARRALGRALRAVAVTSEEHGTPKKFEHPIAPGRLERLPDEVRNLLSDALAHHREELANERAAAAAFRTGLEAQAEGRAQRAAGEQPSAPKALVTEAEARTLFEMRKMLNEPVREWWDEKTAGAEVIGKEGRSEPLPEWGRRNIDWADRSSEYKKIFDGERVMSHAEARARVKEIQKQLQQERPSTRDRAR